MSAFSIVLCMVVGVLCFLAVGNIPQALALLGAIWLSHFIQEMDDDR